MEKEEEEHYYRLICLVVDIGTEVLLNLFKKCIPTSQTPEAFLNNRMHIIYPPKGRKVLNELQYKALTAVPIDMSKFDITLLCVLISNLTNIQAPNGGWNNKTPLATDTSPGALIINLRGIRNGVIAHKSKGKLTKTEFEKYWRETEGILVGLSGVVGHAEQAAVQKDIAHAKVKPLMEDPKCKVNALDIRKLQEDYSDLTATVDQMKEKVKQQDHLSSAVQKNESSLHTVEQRQDQLSAAVQKNESSIQKVDQGLGEVSAAVQKNESSIQALQTEVQKRELTQEDAYLPEEIKRMDSRSQNLYLKALETGEIKVHNIRVMVVGHFGVGKSTLTKRLLGEDVDIKARNSTEGIDVHVKRCRVDLETGMWKVNAKDTFTDDSTARLAHVVQQEVSKIGIAENPTEKASYYQHVPSDGKTSLETSSNDDSTGLSDALSGFQSTDLKQNKESIIQTRTDGAVNTSFSSQTRKELKLLVQRRYNKEMRDITHYADLSIWDFAGQSDFYGTHQMFLSPRSVYILVIDLSQTIDSLVFDDTCCLDAHGERKMKISEFVEFWLQSIHFYTHGEENVILVGTHAGELPEEGRKEQIDEFFDNLRSHLSDKPFRICISDNYFAIDNTIVDPKLEDLKSAIFRVAESKKDNWGERIPARWLTLERELNEMRQKGEKIIESHVFEKTNEMLSSSLPQEELNLFLRFHHACGLLLFFSEDNLRDFIILDSQWLIDAFKCFITADIFMKKKMKFVQIWKQFKKSCVLTKEFIDASWDNSNDKRFLKHKVHLLRLMEKLDIIARPVTYPGDDGHQNNSKILEGDYFTPCMLKEKPPPTLLNTSNSKSTSRLCYTYYCSSDPDSGFVPPAVFHRLLAACMLRWQPRIDHTKKKLLFSGCGVFDLDRSRKEALTLYFRDNFIQMWITHFGSSDYPNVDTCIQTKDTVKSLLQKVCSMQDITTCIKCPETDFSSSEGMIEISCLRDHTEYCCPMHEEPGLKDHTIQSAQVLRHWGEIETAGSPAKRSKQDPDCIQTNPVAMVTKDNQIVIETENHQDLYQRGDDPEIDLTDGPIDVKVECCTRQFYLANFKQSYSMIRKPRGKALILNVNKVMGKPPRRGTDIDRENLHNLLCQLHFDVTIYNDKDGLTAKEIEKKLKDFSQDSGHKNGDSAVICILSHGEEGGIFGSDGKKFELEGAFSLFDNTSCPKLKGKPKIFIVQACRGGALDRGVQYNTDEHDGSDARLGQCPSRSDMVICYPTQYGYNAWRNRNRGSWYVESLVQVFMKYADSEDICTMLNRVNLLVSKKVSNCSQIEMDKMSQMSEYKSTLTKPHLFFFPGIDLTDVH